MRTFIGIVLCASVAVPLFRLCAGTRRRGLLQEAEQDLSRLRRSQ